MTKVDELLELGEVLLKARLESEFLRIPKIKTIVDNKEKKITSFITFSKSHRYGCILTLTENSDLEFLNGMIEEAIIAYKEILYKKLVEEDSNEESDEYEPCKEAGRLVVGKKDD